MAELSLALSGGGAAGIGHVIVLETLDELGVMPCAIAGTSMGALMGAAYASGMAGVEIRHHILDLIDSPFEAAVTYWRTHLSKGLKLLQPVAAQAAVSTMLPDDFPEQFEEMICPLHIVATDYRAREPVVFKTGPVREALAASIAIPGAFAPVKIGERTFVDGGFTNNLPYDLLPPDSFKLAVDVATEPDSMERDPPGPLEAVAGSMRIMIQAMLETRLESSPPDALIRPDSRAYGVFDIWQAEEILEAAAPAAEATKRALDAYFARV
ncbi:patatin-like phospholipase family protein [Dinoroseobacter sp. S375]|uniref:patatin-like phospholipase family protein n=1 Tax=Dinoroseobacter sp. S375 TaxID=3415136 RepID=UPI003C7B1FD1